MKNVKKLENKNLYNEIYRRGYWINIGPATYVKYLILKRITKWNKNDIVLDVGCGSGRFMRLLSPFVKEIHGIDISGGALKIAKILKTHNMKIKKGNALKIPYKNNFFDKVICIDVVEHIKNDEKVLKEIKRVLKQNGEGVIYFVHGKCDPEIRHFHSYDIDKIKEIIKKVGLEIEKVAVHKSLLDKLINPFRKPARDKKRKKIKFIFKFVAYLMLVEQFAPLLPIQGYMVKIRKLRYH